MYTYAWCGPQTSDFRLAHHLVRVARGDLHDRPGSNGSVVLDCTSNRRESDTRSVVKGAAPSTKPVERGYFRRRVSIRLRSVNATDTVVALAYSCETLVNEKCSFVGCLGPNLGAPRHIATHELDKLLLLGEDSCGVTD